MARGGKRPGAGRKRGSIVNPVKRKATEKVSLALDGGATPVEYMLAVMRDDRFSHEKRMEAAKAAAPYIHSRLNTIENDTSHLDNRDPVESGVIHDIIDAVPLDEPTTQENRPRIRAAS